MSFDLAGTGPVLLSLPAWTPGAYEVSNFARWVSEFSAAAGTHPQAATRPLYEPTAPNAEQWLAVITDDPDFEAPCRVLHFNDTMWLQALAGLVLDCGLVLES
jgi:hypothetical protein